MDEKLPLVSEHHEDRRRQQGRVSSKRSLAYWVAAFATFWLLKTCVMVWFTTSGAAETSEIKVPLEVHIMQVIPQRRSFFHADSHPRSKCPDARDCLRDLVVPTMANVSSKVDFKLSYIGRATDHDDGVECKHGQTECLGNIIELCAASLYPDPKIYLGFTMCMTQRYSDIPQRDLVQDCALEHAIDFTKLNHCVSRDDGSYALELLRHSFERSAKANATISCTVRLNNQTRCVRDGGEWKQCEQGSSVQSLIRDVNNQYRAFGT